MLCCVCFKQKMAYDVRMSDWSSDVCSSDLIVDGRFLLDRLLDAPRAQIVEQSIEQNTPVHDGPGFDFQTGHPDTARWPAQIGEAEARLNGDRTRVVWGKRVLGGLDLGGSGIMQNKHKPQLLPKIIQK